MKILQLSDLHYRRCYTDTGEDYIRILTSAPSLKERLYTARKQVGMPDGLLLSGDLTDYGDVEDLRDILKLVWEVFPRVPYAMTPGNHDGKGAFHLISGGTSADISPFQSTARIGNVTVVCPDSSAEGSNDGILGDEQALWLRQTLTALNGAPSVLMTHFHLKSGQHIMPPAAVSPLFEKTVAASPLLAVFTGHTHEPFVGFYGGKPYFSAPGFSFRGTRDADDNLGFEFSCGWALYDVSDCGVRNYRFESHRDSSFFGDV